MHCYFQVQGCQGCPNHKVSILQHHNAQLILKALDVINSIVSLILDVTWDILLNSRMRYWWHRYQTWNYWLLFDEYHRIKDLLIRDEIVFPHPHYLLLRNRISFCWSISGLVHIRSDLFVSLFLFIHLFGKKRHLSLMQAMNS